MSCATPNWRIFLFILKHKEISYSYTNGKTQKVEENRTSGASYLWAGFVSS